MSDSRPHIQEELTETIVGLSVGCQARWETKRNKVAACQQTGGAWAWV